MKMWGVFFYVRVFLKVEEDRMIKVVGLLCDMYLLIKFFSVWMDFVMIFVM